MHAPVLLYLQTVEQKIAKLLYVPYYISGDKFLNIPIACAICFHTIVP